MALPDFASALYTKLSGNAALSALVGTRIYNLQAPASSTFPYVVFYVASGRYVNITPHDSVDYVYRVDSWHTAGVTQAATVASAVHSALHEQTLTVTGWSVYWLVCEAVRDDVSIVSAKQYWRRALEIRVKASKD